MITVYVAGASRNWQRSRAFMERIHAAPNMRVAHDWTIGVQAAADAGVVDNTLDEIERLDFALDDLEAVRACDVFVLLAEVEPTGRGAWVELGYALALVEVRCALDSKGLDRIGGNPSAPTTIVSGGDRRSIFTAPTLVDHECAYDVGTHDDEAFAALAAVAKARA